MLNALNWTLADSVAAIHLLFVMFVVFGEFYIILGLWVPIPGIRNLWFRLAHLFAIGIVVFETVFGISCPLTVLEFELRYDGQSGGNDAGFVANLVQELLYYNFSPIVFDLLYLFFGLLVLLTWVSIPPRRR